MVYSCNSSLLLFKWQWMIIPWVPVALIGTAEAFYVGFKTIRPTTDCGKQEKYGEVSSTPAVPFTSMLYAFNTAKESDLELEKKRKKIAYRHIAWLYAFREQLLVPTEWEHISIEKHGVNVDQRRNRLIKAGFPDYGRTPIFLNKYLSEEEAALQSEYKNFATFLISQQAKDVNELKTVRIFLISIKCSFRNV